LLSPDNTAATGKTLDELYDYGQLDRLTNTQRGALSFSPLGITAGSYQITSGFVRTLKGSPWAGRNEMFEFQNYQDEGTAHDDWITSGFVRTLKGSPWTGRNEMLDFHNYQNEGTAHDDCKRNQRWREVRGVLGSYQD
jgi:hypothetical protein